jgi:hypothetical protein
MQGNKWKEVKMPKPRSLPARFPVGTKYVLEACGQYVRRYIEYPDGRRTQLATRKALTCGCLELKQIGIVPDSDPAEFDASTHRERVVG